MPDYLALDRESHLLCGFDASVSKGNVRLRKAFTLTVPTDAELYGQPAAGGEAPRISDVERAAKRGEWLRGQLRELKISTKQVLVCVPRENCVVRQLEVPADVPPNELPDIVRLQAETKVSSSLDQLLLDFLPLPPVPDAPTRDVLMATVSRDAAGAIQDSLKAADLEPVAMGLSSVAAMELLTRAEENHGFPPEGPSLVLARHGNRVEISLLRQKQLVFTHAARVAGETEEQAIKSTLAEVSRSFVTLERALGGHKLKRAWVIGPRQDTQPLCAALQERLGCDVFPLEPLSQLGLRLDEPNDEANLARFAGPLGMLLSASEQTVDQLDFLNPRKSVVGMAPAKKRLIVRASVAGAIALLLLVGAFIYNSSLAGDVADREAKLARINARVKAGQSARDAANAIAAWLSRAEPPLQQFKENNVALPGTDRIYLKQVEFIGGRGRNGRMRIRAQAFAKRRGDVEALEQRFTELGYTVSPTAGGKETRKDPKYPYEFKLDVVVPDAKTRAKLKKAAASGK